MAEHKTQKRRTARASVPARLREYQRKRDFAKTPEPPPRPIATKARGGGARSEAEVARARGAGAATFMVHKHDATRLHYDLRLEIEGALASWAVPKGPSYDPTERRLAVETEDHPLEYGSFEQRKKGHIHLLLDGEKLRGRWHLVRTGRRGDAEKREWLLFKARDEEARSGFDVVAERPESVVSGRRVTRGPARAATLRAVHPDPEALLRRVDAPKPGRTLAAVSGGRARPHPRRRPPERVGEDDRRSLFAARDAGGDGRCSARLERDLTSARSDPLHAAHDAASRRPRR
jgi:hypothetical protein